MDDPAIIEVTLVVLFVLVMLRSLRVIRQTEVMVVESLDGYHRILQPGMR